MSRSKQGLLTTAVVASLGLCAVTHAADLNNRIIVSFDDQQSRAAAITAASTVFNTELQSIRTLATGGEVFVASNLVDAKARDALIAALNTSSGVEYAELDAILKPMATPNDTRYNEQWHYFESTAGLNLPPAWDTHTGAGTVVAVIDTGYRPHVDLDSKIVGGYDFIGDTFVANDGNGRDSDASDPGDAVAYNECGGGNPASSSSWHGTHVAGTIGAESDNGQGVAGVAWDTMILPIRVLGKCGGYTSDIADGIIWASGGNVSGVPTNNNPAQVLNLSLGGGGSCASTTQSAINTARANGSTVVVAAGNSNANAGNYNPASCDGVISVAAVDRGGNRAYYSNYGSVVDLAAPGGETASQANGVLSTLNTGTSSPGSDNYAFYQGTSMATPHVAGAAALLYEADPSATPDDIEAALVDSARAFPGSCSQCGSGIVDADAAIDELLGAGGPPPPPAGCPVGQDEYVGSLSGTGDEAFEPDGTYYYSSAGTHSGVLSGPGGTDFDLYLWKWNGNGWSTVASSLSGSSEESISYYGSSGYYAWRIYSYSGSGSYTFCLDRP
ncbi:MAG: S8 family peptidase [Gammaproteobacteria bacterium]|nr:S8 family peptidase [Gammaproteobacteria bacterium]